MWWTLILLALAGAIAFYYYCVRHLTKFKDAGIPYLCGLPIFGNMALPLLRQKSFAYVVEDAYNQHPEAKYTGFFDFQTPVIMIRDPDLIKTILVKNFDNFPNHRGFVDEEDDLFGRNLVSLKDDEWREARNILSPAFTSSKIKGMFKLMMSCADEFADHVASLPENDNIVEMKDAFSKYTNDIIASCAFGIRVNSMKDPANEFYVNGKEMTDFTLNRMIKFTLVRACPRISRALGIRAFEAKFWHFFKRIVEDTIRTRDEKGIHRPDMIQLMMETRGKEGKELTIGEMTSQAFIFFFGGFDTTSSAMMFLACELAVNPDVQERLQRDIDAVLEESNGEVTYEAINNMKLLDAVINESMRKWPLGALLDRVCSKRFELPPSLPGLKPYVSEKDDTVWVPVFGLHRDPQYFENPMTFNPDRFMDKNGDSMNIFMPFGLGPRMCIGNRFALMEMKALFFQLLAKCDLKVCPKTPIPLILDKAGFIMKFQGGSWLRIVPRRK